MLVSNTWLVIGDLKEAVVPVLHRGHQTVYHWCIATGRLAGLETVEYGWVYQPKTFVGAQLFLLACGQRVCNT